MAIGVDNLNYKKVVNSLFHLYLENMINLAEDGPRPELQPPLAFIVSKMGKRQYRIIGEAIKFV